MSGFINSFFVSLVALFIVTDAVGLLPLLISLTDGFAPLERKRVVRGSVLTALLIAVFFLLLGRSIFWVMGISMADFQIAGGILLLIFSIQMLLTGNRPVQRPVSEDISFFPLGTPLLSGPAVLTTLLILLDSHGWIITLLAFVVNMVLVFLIFDNSWRVLKVFGRNGIKAFSKLVDILLCAFAVTLIRRGLQGLMG